MERVSRPLLRWGERSPAERVGDHAVVGSVEETVRMFAEVDHPGLALLMDPTNYFEAHNIDRMDQVLKQIFDTLAAKIRIAHAKDVKRAGTYEEMPCRG